MPITFDDKPIRSWVLKHPQNAPTWWAKMASSSEKQLFGRLIFRGRHGISEPTKAPSDAQKDRIAAFVLDNAELRKILSAEICDSIALITDLIREEQAPPAPAEPPPPPSAPSKAPKPKPGPRTGRKKPG